MKIRNIVNRDIVNLTNCEHEPIHVPGSIQPHGFLLGVTADWKIDFCTENIAAFVDLSYKETIGKDFCAIFGNKAKQEIVNYISDDKNSMIFPLEIELLGKSFQLSIHKSHDIYVLEAEPHFGKNEQIAQLYTQTIQFVSNMSSTNTLQELCALVAKGTRDITGYDRVMIYRFDANYNGEIYAENCREDLEPFLGLHYPHTDIPAQARELYMRNQLRLITDIDYVPVPIFTTDDKENKNLDLSLSILRSTSPIHVEYLKNMGVGATLTISLIHHDRLWGLIACHHYSAKNISPEIRLAAKLQGQFISSQIDLRQSRDEYQIVRKTSLALEHLTGLDLPPNPLSFASISADPELLNLCNATGVSICIRGEIYKNGVTPSDDQINAIIAKIGNLTKEAIFTTNKLTDYFPEFNQCSDFAGIIYHSLSNENSIIWYRPETVSEINWAGDPEKAIVKDSNGLHPRNSFNIWKQILKNQSSNWLHAEINAAASYAHALHNQIILMMLSEEEEKYRSQSEILKETNAELENINWISTHDLQEPLRKIQLIISKLFLEIDKAPPQSVHNSLQRVSNSANRMQVLLQDILKYTRIKYTKDTLQKINLNTIMEATLDEMKEVINETGAVIEYENLPEIYGIHFLMKQLFSNILQNSIKYADKERVPIIKVTASQEPEPYNFSDKIFCHWITFTDNGIGFEQEYATSIFKIFTRLHTQEVYSGSGVGLALCKKIMQAFGGTIRAEGKLGEGAVITIYFPCDHLNSLLEM
ncbi:ATP-binding protein [Flavobacterium sp. MDT1-60]|uniref:ATP-binding protein n=1 Tax=Flavobacterium sp. MDT1-60 TaxID=1979344 RepID=UPI001782FA0B|nr:ATP-binding protein [Flavobacterium sp. MDT1-60]QOG01333.1 GAF domain-containing protein [Flavobacterium sp. MDT1-60]